jgi:hypothetical protein
MKSVVIYASALEGLVESKRKKKKKAWFLWRRYALMLQNSTSAPLVIQEESYLKKR